MMKKLSAILRPVLHWVLALVLCTGICFAADGPMLAIANAAEDVASVTVGGTATGYDSFSKALSAANGQTEATITLLADVTLDSQFGFTALTSATKSEITLNMNGHKLTYSQNTKGAIVVRAYTTLNITGNGIFEFSNATYYFSTNKNSKLNIESGTFTGATTGITNTSYSSTLSITGGTFSQNPAQYLADKNAAFDAKTYVIKYTSDTTSTPATWEVLTKEKNTPKAEVTWNPEESEDFTTKYTALYTSFTGAKTAILGSGTTPVVMKLLDDWPITARQAFRIGTGTTDKTAFDITLDLYGHRIYLEETVTADTKGFEIINANTTLTITDTTEDADGAINMGSYTLFGANKYGNIIVEKGKFTGGTFLNGSGTLSITGGTFNIDPKDYVAENYTVQENKGDTTTYTVLPTVATVTEGEATTPSASCATLSAALQEANKSTATAVTITLLNDAALDSQFTLSGTKTITLAMNGKTLTYSGADTPVFVVSNGTTFKITGTGTFNFDPAQYLGDKDKALTDKSYVMKYTGESGDTAAKWEVLTKNETNTAVAEVTYTVDAKTTYTAAYTTPDGAVAAVSGNTATIKLLDNISYSETITVSAGTNLTVDLNGKSLTGTGTDRVFEVFGTLTLTDSSNKYGTLCGSDKYKAKKTNGTVLRANGGSITIGNVIIQEPTLEADLSAVFANNNGSYEINGARVYGSISRANGCNVVIKDGYFSEKVTLSDVLFSDGAATYKQIHVTDAAYAYADTPYVSTCDYKTGTITYDINKDGIPGTLPYADDETVDTTSYEFYYIEDSEGNPYTVEITMSTVVPVGNNRNFEGWYANPEGTGTKYGNDPDTHEYKGSALTLYAKWGEEIDLETGAVAQIGEDKYATLAAALYYVEDKETVTLLASVVENVKAYNSTDASVTKAITLDLNGYHIEGQNTGSALNIQNRVALTLKDSAGTGYIYGEAKSSGGAVDNRGTFTLKSGIVEGYAPTSGSAVYNGNTFIMNGGIVRAAYKNGDVICVGYAEGTADKDKTEAIYTKQTISGSDTETNCSTQITGGYVYNGIDCSSGYETNYSITGGYFSEDPTAYLGIGYVTKNGDFYSVGTNGKSTDVENEAGVTTSVKAIKLADIAPTGTTKVTLISGMGATESVDDKTGADSIKVVEKDQDNNEKTVFTANAAGIQLRYDNKLNSEGTTYGNAGDNVEKANAINYADLRMVYYFTLPDDIILDPEVENENVKWGWNLTFTYNGTTKTADVTGVNFSKPDEKVNEYRSNLVLTNINVAKLAEVDFKVTFYVEYTENDVTYRLEQDSSNPLIREIGEVANYYKDNLLETGSEEYLAYSDAKKAAYEKYRAYITGLAACLPGEES